MADLNEEKPLGTEEVLKEVHRILSPGKETTQENKTSMLTEQDKEEAVKEAERIFQEVKSTPVVELLPSHEKSSLDEQVKLLRSILEKTITHMEESTKGSGKPYSRYEIDHVETPKVSDMAGMGLIITAYPRTSKYLDTDEVEYIIPYDAYEKLGFLHIVKSYQSFKAQEQMRMSYNVSPTEPLPKMSVGSYHAAYEAYSSLDAYLKKKDPSLG